ncbi:hypothetical protein Dimus_033015 [Dionaea muscipula]
MTTLNHLLGCAFNPFPVCFFPFGAFACHHLIIIFTSGAKALLYIQSNPSAFFRSLETIDSRETLEMSRFELISHLPEQQPHHLIKTHGNLQPLLFPDLPTLPLFSFKYFPSRFLSSPP